MSKLQMNKHREQATRALSNCSGSARVLFGLLAAERLRACCWVAHSGTKIWSVYAAALEQGFLMASAERVIQVTTVRELIAELESIVPDGGEPLYVQGQSAIICALEALRLFEQFDGQTADSIINSIIDAFDNYTFYVQRMITGEEFCSEKYPLLKRELFQQLDDIEFVTTVQDVSAVRQRRIENLQFSVPVAVGAVSNDLVT